MFEIDLTFAKLVADGASLFFVLPNAVHGGPKQPSACGNPVGRNAAS